MVIVTRIITSLLLNQINGHCNLNMYFHKRIRVFTVKEIMQNNKGNLKSQVTKQQQQQGQKQKNYKKNLQQNKTKNK